MSKFFVESHQINDNKIKIIGEDVNHIKNVLRLTINNEIKICNKDTSQNYICIIQEIDRDYIICEIIHNVHETVESNIDITIYQGIPKSDKMDLIIQKATELGANRFVPVSMKRCIVKISPKDESKKLDRWQKIAEVAAKQSGRDIVPKIESIISIEEIGSKIKDYDLFFVAYELEKDIMLKQVLKEFKNKASSLKIGFLIGPEGGLDESEVNYLKNNNAKIVSLGKRILRTETVALSVTSIIMYELEN